jgi:aryl-alcohol dehydrogenase-like predicted oxidoreductase
MLGVKLALTGHDVTLILRGANLEAVQQNGLTLIEENGRELLAKPIKATADLAQAGVQDLVILGLKAHQVSAVAADRGVSNTQVALAWVLRNSAITAPIVGASKLHHLDEALAALDLTLTDAEAKALEAPYRPKPVLDHA